MWQKYAEITQTYQRYGWGVVMDVTCCVRTFDWLASKENERKATGSGWEPVLESGCSGVMALPLQRLPEGALGKLGLCTIRCWRIWIKQSSLLDSFMSLHFPYLCHLCLLSFDLHCLAAMLPQLFLTYHIFLEYMLEATRGVTGSTASADFCRVAFVWCLSIYWVLTFASLMDEWVTCCFTKAQWVALMIEPWTIAHWPTNIMRSMKLSPYM